MISNLKFCYFDEEVAEFHKTHKRNKKAWNIGINSNRIEQWYYEDGKFDIYLGPKGTWRDLTCTITNNDNTVWQDNLFRGIGWQAAISPRQFRVMILLNIALTCSFCWRSAAWKKKERWELLMNNFGRRLTCQKWKSKPLIIRVSFDRRRRR